MNKLLGLGHLPTDSYEFGGQAFTTQELWCKISEKINIIIEHFKYLDENFKNEKENVQKKLEYLLGEGLTKTVAEELLKKIADGTLGELINSTLLADINSKVDTHKTIIDLLNENYGELETKLFELSQLVDVNVKEINLEIDEMKHYVTPEMFGAKGDGIEDDTLAIQSAIDTGKTVYCSKRYSFSSITLNTSKFISVGELISTNTHGYGIIINTNNSDIYITKYTSLCGGIDIIPKDNLLYGVTLNVKECVAEGNAINFSQHNKAVQYCYFYGFYVSNSANALNVYIDVTDETSNTWFNENHFEGCHLQAPKGFSTSLKSTTMNKLDGNYFNNISPEASKYFCELQNVHNTIFNSPRVEEISIIKGYEYKFIFLKEFCDVKFNDVYCYANGIDTSTLVDGEVVLDGYDILSNNGTKLYNYIKFEGKKVVDVALKYPYNKSSNNILNKTYSYPLLNDFNNTPFNLFIVSASTIIIPDEYFIDNQLTLEFYVNRFSAYADVTIRNPSGSKTITIDNTGNDKRLMLKCYVALGKIFLE